MLLEKKSAVVYGGGGAIGGAVARAFAREGARVHLAGRTAESLEVVAEQIRTAGGSAQTAVLDALDEAAVDAHAQQVAPTDGGIDISMNVIAHPYAHGVPMADMAPEDFLAPSEVAIRTSFLTWRAAARQMRAKGSGVILAFGGSGPPHRDYYLGGTQVAFAAIESMRRQLATELGPHGVRVLTLRTGGIPESVEDPELRERLTELTFERTLLGRVATLEDVGRVAAFAASDDARTLTATELNMTCGAMVD